MVTAEYPPGMPRKLAENKSSSDPVPLWKQFIGVIGCCVSTRKSSKPSRGPTREPADIPLCEVRTVSDSISESDDDIDRSLIQNDMSGRYQADHQVALRFADDTQLRSNAGIGLDQDQEDICESEDGSKNFVVGDFSSESSVNGSSNMDEGTSEYPAGHRVAMCFADDFHLLHSPELGLAQEAFYDSEDDTEEGEMVIPAQTDEGHVIIPGVPMFEDPGWVSDEEEIHAIHFASEDQAFISRFEHLWEDSFAEYYDQSSFADFDLYDTPRQIVESDENGLVLPSTINSKDIQFDEDTMREWRMLMQRQELYRGRTWRGYAVISDNFPGIMGEEAAKEEGTEGQCIAAQDGTV